MKVMLAKHAGFCMGVRRAVETTLEAIRQQEGKVATYGPLIHNPQVLNLLEERGVRILQKIPEKQAGNVIIRAHGIPPQEKARLQAAGALVKDATCPRVVKVQAIIKKYAGQGFGTVIIGDKKHAEVEGLMGYAGSRGLVISGEDDVRALQKLPPSYIIVSQTTQDEATFTRLSRMILDRFPGGRVFETICDSTHKRQDEVRGLSRRVEAMVVVGGRSSANTQRLGEIARDMGCAVFMVETEKELDYVALANYNCIGVTAGASTPTWLINRVVRTLEAIPGKGEGRLRSLFFKGRWLLLATNFYVGLGGGILAFTCGLLQNVAPKLSHFLIGFGYIFAMHNFNRFTDPKAEKFNDPIGGLFTRPNRWLMLSVSTLALTMALVLSAGFGLRPFLLLTGMSFLGVLYSVQFIPRFLMPILRIRMLKEIPGSKTFFVAMAWALVTTVLPAWEAGRAGPRTMGVLLFVLLLIYVRSALFDVFDVQADRLVGKETLPVLIGEKRTLVFLHFLMGLLVVLLLFLPTVGLMTSLGYWFIPAVIYLVRLTLLYEKEIIRAGPKLDFMLESMIIIGCGLVWVGQYVYSAA
jgi:(E)-4-hydroxy-3-methyl-but-2-enyl pyrophosphate reductase